jgi:phosphate transport system substrate-binding protein
LILGLVSLLLAGCESGRLAELSDPPTPTPAPPAYQGTIVCVGSNVLTPLIQRIANEFSALEPNAFVFVITSTSQLGLTALQDDGADIALSDVRAEELPGVEPQAQVETRIAAIPYGVVVNPDTKITNLTHDQLAAIYSGQLRNWNAVGGANLSITPLQASKGTGLRYLFAKTFIVAPSVVEIPAATSNDPVGDVVRTPGAIAYAPLSMVTNAVQVVAIDGTLPSKQNVGRNHYPFWSYARMYTKGDPGGLARVFISYVLSPNVQKNIVAAMGYTPISQMADQPQP